MPRGRRRESGSRRYECEYPPCIHVVVDPRRRIYKIFVEHEYGETGDTIVVTMAAEDLKRACAQLEEALSEGYREARDTEIDYLARKYLNISRPLDDYE